MSLHYCFPCQPPVHVAEYNNAVACEADSPGEAASVARGEMLRVDPNLDLGYLETIFVVTDGVKGYRTFQQDRVLYEEVTGELACCGGDFAGGHSGFCDKRERDDDD